MRHSIFLILFLLIVLSCSLLAKNWPSITKKDPEGVHIKLTSSSPGFILEKSPNGKYAVVVTREHFSDQKFELAPNEYVPVIKIMELKNPKNSLLLLTDDEEKHWDADIFFWQKESHENDDFYTDTVYNKWEKWLNRPNLIWGKPHYPISKFYWSPKENFLIVFKNYARFDTFTVFALKNEGKMIQKIQPNSDFLHKLVAQSEKIKPSFENHDFSLRIQNIEWLTEHEFTISTTHKITPFKMTKKGEELDYANEKHVYYSFRIQLNRATPEIHTTRLNTAAIDKIMNE